MQEVLGDLWDIGETADAIVITTNSTRKRNGDMVMGAGCALEAAQKFPGLPRAVGTRHGIHGNIPAIFEQFKHGTATIVTFPTKWEWWKNSDLKLIARSALELEHFATVKAWTNIVMPRVGCGRGRLDWYEDVEPILFEVLDDRFTVVSHD